MIFNFGERRRIE